MPNDPELERKLAESIERQLKGKFDYPGRQSGTGEALQAPVMSRKKVEALKEEIDPVVQKLADKAMSGLDGSMVTRETVSEIAFPDRQDALAGEPKTDAFDWNKDRLSIDPKHPKAKEARDLNDQIANLAELLRESPDDPILKGVYDRTVAKLKALVPGTPARQTE